MGSEISIQNFNFSIGKNQILKNITVDIPKNKLTAIIGPSGCGKSTLLRSINRMTNHIENLSSSGNILVGDENIYSPDIDLMDLRRRVGMIAQTPNPLPMSIYNNVIYGPKIHGTRDKNVLDLIVHDCLTRVGLWEEVSDRLHSPASQLSLGQQQRLCLARSLANKPDVLLCDETTSALDPISAKIIENELMELKNEYTILFVTHILRQARRIADHVIFIYFGEIIESAPAHQFFSEPRDPRSRQYIEGVI